MLSEGFPGLFGLPHRQSGRDALLCLCVCLYLSLAQTDPVTPFSKCEFFLSCLNLQRESDLPSLPPRLACDLEEQAGSSCLPLAHPGGQVPPSPPTPPHGESIPGWLSFYREGLALAMRERNKEALAPPTWVSPLPFLPPLRLCLFPLPSFHSEKQENLELLKGQKGSSRSQRCIQGKLDVGSWDGVAEMGLWGRRGGQLAVTGLPSPHPWQSSRKAIKGDGSDFVNPQRG